MSKRMVQFSIYRYDPDKDDAPYMQDISVELEPTDRKLLDALTKLKAKYQRQERSGLPDRHRQSEAAHRAASIAGSAGHP